MSALSKAELGKQFVGMIKEYQKANGLTYLQTKMSVMADLNPWMFRQYFGNNPEDWKKIDDAAGKVENNSLEEALKYLPEEITTKVVGWWGK